MIKNLEFNNAKHEKITGILKEKNKSGPLLVIAHGFNSSKEHPATVGVTDLLYKMGHSSFSFDFSKNASTFSLKEQVSDILAIINHFKNKREIILLAPSLGALGVVIAAIQSRQVKGLITINGFFGTAQLGKSILKTYLLFRVWALFKAQYKESWDYFKKYCKPEKIQCKSLVIHARNDEVVFISQSEGFFRKLSGEKEFVILEDADHDLTRESYMQETASLINRWLKKWF